jgi:plastocyanin
MRRQDNRHTRRRAVQALALGGGGMLLAGATRVASRPAVLAQESGDDDDSGRGRGRGRGRGGDDDHHEEEGAELAAAQAAEIPAGSIEIRIVGDDAGDFVPGDMTVDLGQSITFVNTHSDEHTATGSGFDTGIIPEGGAVTVTLNEPGSFAYACLIHPEMTGRIAVRGEDGTVPAAAAQSAAPPEGGQVVRIANLAFDPAAITVPTGTTVTWNNEDSVPHTVTALDGSFDSGIFDPGASFSWTFSDPGAFDYQCLLHPAMQGSVTVEGAPVAAGSPVPAADDAPAAEAAPVVGGSGQPGVWVVELIPDDAATLAPQRVLLSLHADGLVQADFAAIGAETPGGLLGSGHGIWRLEGDRLSFDLIAMVIEPDGRLRGTVTMHAEGTQGEEGSLNGDWTFSLSDASGAILSEGVGTWQGGPAPLGG